MQEKENNITKQNKLIIAGLLASTFLIVGFGIYTSFNIQSTLKSNYRNYSEVMAKTLANLSESNIKTEYLQNIIEDNENIIGIKYTAADGKIINEVKNKNYDLSAKTFSIMTPLDHTDGILTVTYSADGLNKMFSTTRFSIFSVFALCWFVFASITLISTYLSTCELRMLKNGVKKISTGEFGYKIEEQEVGSEVKELFNAFNDMSSKLHVYEEQNIEQLTLERNKFEAVLLSIANGVVVCDNNDNVVLVNEHAKELLELNNKQILNSKIQDYVDSENNFCFKDKIQEFKAMPVEEQEKAPVVFNISVDKHIIKSIVSPMFSRNRDYLGYIIVLIDITRETEIDTMRSQFISNVSHELRTPVTVLRSYIDTLYNYSNEFDDDTKKEFLGTINNEIIRLNEMVNDILDFSRLDSDYELEKEPNNFVQVVEDAVNQVKIFLEQHHISLTIEKNGEFKDFPFNYNSIKRAVTNLLSNAIKYSPDNSKILVNIIAEKGSVSVSVTDEGCGIAQEHLKHIFDRFYRVENKAHTIKGTGLGLQLVKTTVEKHHNGKVFVSSEVGKGSKFGFTLPTTVQTSENEESLSALS